MLINFWTPGIRGDFVIEYTGEWCLARGDTPGYTLKLELDEDTNIFLDAGPLCTIELLGMVQTLIISDINTY